LIGANEVFSGGPQNGRLRIGEALCGLGFDDCPPIQIDPLHCRSLAEGLEKLGAGGARQTKDGPNPSSGLQTPLPDVARTGLDVYPRAKVSHAKAGPMKARKISLESTQSAESRL
jgi:hypothetical protein